MKTTRVMFGLFTMLSFASLVSAEPYHQPGAQSPYPVNRHDPYYNNWVDFYSGFNTSRTLKLIRGFQTYVQTDGWTCGDVAAMMVLNHFTKSGLSDAKVRELVPLLKSNADYGTDTVNMKAYFDSIGWNTSVNYQSVDPDGTVHDETLNPVVGYYDENGDLNYLFALKFLRDNVMKGIPTMVEWIDWGGHWQVVIGYDDMGTPGWTKDAVRDDVLIMADPGDKTDHNWNGYTIVPAARFVYMWYDDYCLARNENAHGYGTDLATTVYLWHPFLVATPPDFVPKPTH